jgi:hypothetical protein
VNLSRLQHRLRGVQREYLGANLPHGLLGPGLFWPDRDPRRKKHLQLWWQTRLPLPRAVWLIGEYGLWLRWVGYAAWTQSFAAVNENAAAVGEAYGVTWSRQFLRTAWLALWWGVPPDEAYVFGLYRGKPSNALDYIYDNETVAYHHHNSPGIAADLARQRLRDKAGLASELAAQGLPVAATYRCIAKQSGLPLAQLLPTPGAWFCKTRTGSAGTGAFTAVWDGGKLYGQRLEGPALIDSAAVETAWVTLLKMDDALIQPCLINHPALQHLVANGDVITLRVITRWDEGTALPVYAALEIPVAASLEHQQGGHVIVPLDAVAGRIQPNAVGRMPGADDRRRYAEKCALLPHDFEVPDWQALLSYCSQAHAGTQALSTIAWDWVVTPSGPVLLEGNSAWSATMPQLFGGGFLSCLRPDYPESGPA